MVVWTVNITPNVAAFVLWDPWGMGVYNHLLRVAPCVMDSKNGMPGWWMGTRKICVRKTGYQDVIIDIPAGLENQDHTFDVTLVPDPAFNQSNYNKYEVPEDPSNFPTGGGFHVTMLSTGAMGVTNLYPDYIDAVCYGTPTWMPSYSGCRNYDSACASDPYSADCCPVFVYHPPIGYSVVNSYRYGIISPGPWGGGWAYCGVTLKKTGYTAPEGTVRRSRSGQLYVVSNGMWVKTITGTPPSLSSFNLSTEVSLVNPNVQPGEKTKCHFFIKNEGSNHYYGGNTMNLMADNNVIMTQKIPEIPAGERVSFPEINVTASSTNGVQHICLKLVD